LQSDNNSLHHIKIPLYSTISIRLSSVSSSSLRWYE
jgi:hypothetical protein